MNSKAKNKSVVASPDRVGRASCPAIRGETPRLRAAAFGGLLAMTLFFIFPQNAYAIAFILNLGSNIKADSITVGGTLNTNDYTVSVVGSGGFINGVVGTVNAFVATGSTFYIAGPLTTGPSTNFNLSGVTFIFNAQSGTHIITIGTNQYFTYLTVNAPGAVYRVTTNLQFTSGILKVSGGTLDLATNGLDLNLWNSANLTIDGGTLDANNANCDLDIDGSVTVTSGTLIAPPVLDSTSFLVGGNWEVSGTGIFTHSNGRVVMDTFTNDTIKTSSSNADDFYELYLSNGNGVTTYLQSDLGVLKLLNVTNGTLDADADGAGPGTTISNLFIAGDWQKLGTFIPRTSTVTFNGSTGSQVIYHSPTLYNVIISNTAAPGSNTVTLGGVINGNLTINNGNLSDYGLALAGNLTVGASGAISPGAYTWTFNGATDATQTIDINGNGTAGTVTFYNLTKTTSGTGTTTTLSIDDADTVIVNNACTLKGVSANRLILKSDDAVQTVDLRVLAGGTIDLDYLDATRIDSATGILMIATNATAPSSVNWDVGGAVGVNFIWDGSSSTVWGTAANWDRGRIPLTASNVTIPSASNAPVLDAARTMKNLTIQVGGALSLASFNLTLAGPTFSNDGTLKLQGDEVISFGAGGAVMDTNSGTFEYVGGGDATYTVDDWGAPDYYNLTINKAAENFLLESLLTVANNLTITAGTLDTDSNGDTAGGFIFNIVVLKNWVNSGTFKARTGWVTFNGTGSATDPDSILNAGSSAFHGLSILAVSNGSTYEVQLSTNGLTADNIRIPDGELDTNGLSVTITDIDPASGSKGLELSSATSKLTCGASTIDINEVDATQAIIISNAAATIDFGTSTWTVAGGWDGILNNVITALANSSLTFDGSGGPFTVDLQGGNANLDIAFNTTGTGTGSWTLSSALTADVLSMNGNDTAQTLTTGANTITATSLSIGNAAGAAYTLDASNTTLIDINGAVSFTKGTGALTVTLTSSTWNVLGGWAMDSGATVTGAPPVTFDGATQTANINSGGKAFGALTINASGSTYTALTNNISAASLTVTLGTLDLAAKYLTVTGNLLVNGGTLTGSNAACDIDVDGNVTVSSGTLAAPAAADDTSFLVGGSWNVSGTGTFTHSSGRLVLDAGAVGKTIVTTSSNADDFNQLTFNNSLGGWTASDGMEILSDLNIAAGAFTAPTGILEVRGNFTKAGAFTHNSGTVTLNGTNQTITGSTAFNNLTKTVASAATLTLEDTGVYQVAGLLTLKGASGQLLTVTSDDAIQTADLIVNTGTGTIDLDYLTPVRIDSSTGLLMITANSTAPSACVNWQGGTSGVNFTWDGSAGTSTWITAANWDRGMVPATNSNVIIPSASFDPALGANRTVNNVTIQVGGILVLGGSNLTLAGNTFSNNGTVRMQGGETISFGAGGAVMDIDSGLFEYVGGGAGTYTVSDWGATDYYDLKINKAAEIFLLGGALTVANDLTLSAGTLDTDSNGDTAGGTIYNPTIKGNANFTGTFKARTSTLTLFDDAVDEIKTLTTSCVTAPCTNLFNNLTINHTASTTKTARVSGTLDIDGTFTLSAGVLDLATNNVVVNVAGNVSIANGASVTKATSSAWTFDGTTQAFTDNNATKQNLGIIQVGT